MRPEELSEKDEGGRPFTSGLFDIKGGSTYEFLEFYTIFMESADPTGRAFALQAFTAVPPYERWAEYNRMLKNSWFAGHIANWLDELEIKMRSDAIQAIAKGCETKDFSRYRWLAEGKASHVPKIGKPSAEDNRKEAGMQSELRRINPNATKIIEGLK